MISEEKLSLYPIQELDEYIALFIQALTIQLSDPQACHKKRKFQIYSCLLNGPK